MKPATGARFFGVRSPTCPPTEVFGVILANINRNILLNEIPRYAQHLTADGWLVVSGFYETDAPDIIARAESAGLTFQKMNTRNQWAMESRC